MRPFFLPFSPPAVGDEECEAIVDAIRSGWISRGPKCKAFEVEFSASFSSTSALALNSCTAGLHLALVALGIGPGDEVITTPLTFCASVNVIEHVGARPILVDVEPDTLNICPEKIAAAVSSRTKAIIPVHYAGHPVDLDPIEALAAKHGLAIVEDAAHAVPAKYRGRWIGSGSNLTAFSFYATKNLTTSEGGMLTGDPLIVERARILSQHGMSRDAWKRYDKGGSWRYDVVAPGFKYNMTDLQAAMGLVQLRKLPAFQSRRRAIVARYQDAFSMVDALQVPVERSEVEHAWHLYVLRLRPERLLIDRDRFIDEMTVRNIGTSVHFIPVHVHPYYRDKYGYTERDFPVAFDSFSRLVTLPLHPGLSDSDVADVIAAVLDIIKVNRR